MFDKILGKPRERDSSGGGGATVPGGANTQIQFNAAGAFAGSPNMVYDETVVGDPFIRLQTAFGRLLIADSSNIGQTGRIHLADPVTGMQYITCDSESGSGLCQILIGDWGSPYPGNNTYMYIDDNDRKLWIEASQFVFRGTNTTGSNPSILSILGTTAGASRNHVKIVESDTVDGHVLTVDSLSASGFSFQAAPGGGSVFNTNEIVFGDGSTPGGISNGAFTYDIVFGNLQVAGGNINLQILNHLSQWTINDSAGTGIFHTATGGTMPGTYAGLGLDTTPSKIVATLGDNGVSGITKIVVDAGTSRVYLVEGTLGAASNGYVWTLIDSTTGEGGWVASSGGGGSGITIGSTAITGGTTACMLFEQSGVVQETTDIKYSPTTGITLVTNTSARNAMDITSKSGQSVAVLQFRASDGSDIGGIYFNDSAKTSMFAMPANAQADPSASSIVGSASFGYNYSGINFYGTGLGAARNSKFDVWFQTGAVNGGGYRWYTGGVNERMTIDNVGKVGIGQTAPTAILHIKAGTATANTAPLRFTSGTLLTTPEFGCVEYSGSNFYFTIGGNVRVPTLDLQGADLASANNLVLGTDGNTFEVTGTTQINLIANTGWQNGSRIILLFTSTPTVKHNQTTSGANITIQLAGAADFVAAAGNTLTLVLSEIGGTQAWRETSRKV